SSGTLLGDDRAEALDALADARGRDRGEGQAQARGAPAVGIEVGALDEGDAGLRCARGERRRVGPGAEVDPAEVATLRHDHVRMRREVGANRLDHGVAARLQLEPGALDARLEVAGLAVRRAARLRDPPEAGG